jgi:hypothetical protein
MELLAKPQVTRQKGNMLELSYGLHNVLLFAQQAKKSQNSSFSKDFRNFPCSFKAPLILLLN